MSRRTWLEWWDGMVVNFMRPGFRTAWDDLKDRTVLHESADPGGRLEQFELLRHAVHAIAAHQAHDPRKGHDRS